MAVKHATVATGADDPTKEINKGEWNANHTVENDTITEAMLSISDNTTKNVSTTAHGFVPKAPNDTTKFLRGDATWAVPTASVTLDGVAAAASDQAGISNGDWNIRWNWAKTTNSEVAFEFGESAASTNGTSTGGVPNQVLLKLSTVASSTMSPLSVYSRGTHIFSVAPSSNRVVFNPGSSGNPTIVGTTTLTTGLYWNATGTALGLVTNGTEGLRITGGATTQALFAVGAAATPSVSDLTTGNSGLYWPTANFVAMAAGGVEIARWGKASSGGGWQIMDEADSDPTTTELDSLDSIAIYNKNNKLVFAYNNAGTITYISIQLDGSTTTWTHSTTAP